ncbi:oligogalacturonate-specific porin KdgM family protein [Vibrio sp. 10N.261.51.F12]|uniref:oligogalacturonate-specific porin KdgM family protein n=1 Tax=Vibrio sp. 10N.261.51.F12 TaxID=3229679 RepID=UPI0035522DD2
MKKVLALTALAVASTSAFASSSYVTGNVQFHDSYLHGAKQTSTLEAGHTFDSNTTLLVEFDGIPLGKLDPSKESAPTPFTTLGVEQVFNISDNLWVAAGYHHLINNGETFQYRPLVKIGYNFDNGLSLSNRTRQHIQADDTRNNETRLDNKIAYSFSDQPLALSYNNVYVIKQGDADNSMDHELRATWTRSGVQPYLEYRNQANNENNALVFGASYGF